VSRSQLALDEPYPATPREREAAVLSAFGNRGPGMVVSMRAKRVPCLGACGELVGRSCVQSGPAGSGRRRVRSAPHPSRVALSVPCEVHDVEAGSVCGDGERVCPARERAVAADVAMVSLMVLQEAETPPPDTIAALDAWLAENAP
jgi:hypothetical protein